MAKDWAADSPFSGIINALEEITAFQNVIDVVNFSTSVVCSDFDLDSLLGTGSLSSTDRCGWVGRWSSLMTGMPWVTFVTSAGNANRDIDASNKDDRVIPAAFSMDLQNTITAGGLWGATPRGQSDGWVYDRAEISNFGEAITLGAPNDVWALDIEDSDGYSYQTGTSFSAPMVTGAVALLRALDPELSPSQIKQILPSYSSLVRVCNSYRSHPDDPCADEEQEWRSLDAGGAVSELLRRSVKANIDLTRATNPKNAALDTEVNLDIPVKNVGEYTWNFHMDALVCAPSGSGFLYQLPLGHLINPGGEGVFNVSFDASEFGEWDITVGAFRDDIVVDPQRSSSLDQDQLTIFVPGGTGSSSQATPTPTPTIEVTVVVATEAPTYTPSPGATVEGTEELPEGAPGDATAVKCVQQEEGEAAGLAGRDANVILVADTSGSMDGGKIIALRETAKDFFRNVTDPAEYVGLVAFDSSVRTVIDLTAKGSISDVEWDQAVEGLYRRWRHRIL